MAEEAALLLLHGGGEAESSGVGKQGQQVQLLLRIGLLMQQQVLLMLMEWERMMTRP